MSSTKTRVIVSVPPPAPYIITTVIGLLGQFEANTGFEFIDISNATNDAAEPSNTFLLVISLFFINLLQNLITQLNMRLSDFKNQII